MVGHGRPHALPRRVVALWATALAVALLASPARSESLRLRLEWGGGPPQAWQGNVTIVGGVIADPAPLGIEADEPGSMWIAGDALVIRPPSPRSYDGVDLAVDAPLNASLVIELTAAESGVPTRIPLSELVHGYRSVNLDQQGNRLLVRRAPGDKLRVAVKHRGLVFAPGDVLKLEITPHLLAVSPDSRVRIGIQLVDTQGTNLWSAEHNAKAGDLAPLPLGIPLPNQEGIYSVEVAATQPGWQKAVRPLAHPPLAERRVQVIVVGPQPAKPAATGELAQVVEIDPANPRWWERLPKLPQLASFSRLRKGPLGSGHAQVQSTPIGPCTHLSPSKTQMSWEAYWLPVVRSGVPHVLEVDYPADAPQSLAISIVEPNAAGALTPIGLDSGIRQEADETRPGVARHRLVFWPRTKLPLVLLTNLSDRTAAAYGKLRILAGWDELPPAGVEPAASGRLLSAYLDRPLFAENFSATEALDPWSGRSLDDWLTFYEGSSRLVQYLRHVGFDGLMVSVLADGSSVYPSSLVQPTVRYDTGAFFDSGQDPVRKDVFELMLRMFDRAGLRLVPSLDFAAPLPALESLRRAGGPQAAGLEWIGADGVAWRDVNPTRRGMAPYYNLLDPRVQEAMLDVVRELLRNYGGHPALAGLALRLSADGYAQLPGPEWGLDDATIGRFQTAAGLRVPGEGPRRFAERARFLAIEQHRRAWLEWRADEVHRFYRQVHAELNASRPGSTLYLAGPEMFSSPELQYEFRPTLPRRSNLADALLEIGIDARRYGEGIVLLRTERAAAAVPGGEAVAMELAQAPDCDTYFAGLPAPAGLIYQPPHEVRLASFDAKSPFKPAFTELVVQGVAAERACRRQLIHNIAALDSRAVFDGGCLLPLGRESELAEIAAVYRRLPAVRFTTVEAGGEPAQPVTVRYCTHGSQSFAYAVNDAPFAATLRVDIDAPVGAAAEVLGGGRPEPTELGGRLVWNVRLKPYDLVALRLNAPGARLTRPTVSVDDDATARLAGRIRLLGARTARLVDPAPLELPVNGGFEAATGTSAVPGWNGSDGAELTVDASQHHGGRQSARLRSSGAEVRLTSDPFAPPTTGRLAVAVWLRIADAARQPPLRIAVEGKLQGYDYYRFAALGQSAEPGQSGVPLGPRWAQYVFQVDDLPLTGLSATRVRFDLAGPGEVWIDEVQLFDLRFSRMERVELAKLIALADVKLQKGQIGDCLRILDGYWPRFLETHVPLPAGEPVAVAPPTPPAREPERSSLLDRMRGMLPNRLRF